MMVAMMRMINAIMQGFEAGQSTSYNQTQQSNCGPKRKDNIHLNPLS